MPVIERTPSASLESTAHESGPSWKWLPSNSAPRAADVDRVRQVVGVTGEAAAAGERASLHGPPVPAASTYVAARAAAGAHARLRTWGSAAERARVRADLERAAEWARDRGRPLFLGEFGTIAHARMADRAAWTRVVRTEAERLGLPWAYWDHDTDFGASDRAHGAWHAPILHTLLGGG